MILFRAEVSTPHVRAQLGLILLGLIIANYKALLYSFYPKFQDDAI